MTIEPIIESNNNNAAKINENLYSVKRTPPIPRKWSVRCNNVPKFTAKLDSWKNIIQSSWKIKKNGVKSKNPWLKKKKTSNANNDNIQLRYENKSLNRWATLNVRISSIITIKRKRTTIAPTYTIKNNNAKYSNCRTNRSKLPKKNTKINKRIECIGFVIPIIKDAVPKSKEEIKDKKICINF